MFHHFSVTLRVMRQRLTWLLVTIAISYPSTVAMQALGQDLKPADNLVVEGIPPIPLTMVDRVRAYTESRGATFFSWHPVERKMLIGTRFGTSNQVHMVEQPMGARTQLTFFNEPVGSATWEPGEGKYFLLSRDVGGNEFGQLFRFDMETEQVTLLTDGQRSQNGNILWSPSKKRCLYTSTRRNGADRDLWTMDPTDLASHRMVLERTGGGWGVSDWSHDEKRVLMLERLSVNQSRLWILELSSGTVEALVEDAEEVAYSSAKFASPDTGVFYTSDVASEFQQLFYHDLATGRRTCLTPKIPWDIESFEPSKDGKWVALVANEAGVSRLYLYDVEKQVLQALDDQRSAWREGMAGIPAGVMALGEWHPQRSEFSFSISSARSTSDVYSVQVDQPAVTRWTRSELGGLAVSRVAEPRLIHWKGFDGLELSGFLYAPTAPRDQKRPVIINIHGGPEGQSRPTFLGRNNYLMTELDVVMIYPNVRGSTGFGKSFVKLDNGEKRMDSVRDIETLLDWIAEQPELDANRVMVMGGSYGGFMTLAVATEYSSRIRCAIDIVGISHFGTFLKSTESYRRDLRRVEYGDERKPEMAEFFERISPLNHADKITKPLFIVQGGNDPRVPLSEAEQMASRVRAKGSPLWYLMAKDEGHGFRKKNNVDFQFYASILFVEQHLLAK